MTAHTVTTYAETYTLTAADADTITVQIGSPVKSVKVINLDAPGGTRIWADACRTPVGGRAERAMPTPTIGGSGCHPVDAGAWWGIDFGEDGYDGAVTVVVVGGGNQYTIEVEPV